MWYSTAMKYLGIDYGTKRIGLAVSDDSGMMAFPRGIVSGGATALASIVKTITEEGVQKIVVGHSIDQAGNRNMLADDVDAFVAELEKLSGLPVEFQDERFTSMMARSFDFTKDDYAANPRRANRVEHVDDRAAAVMLQRYLDRMQ